MNQFQRAIQEDAIARDSRVRALSKWYTSFDPRKLRATYVYEGEEFTCSCRYVVCDVCEGRGKHVNPAIDAGGLTAADFAADPDFFDDYRSGKYDVTCYGCGGRGLFPIPKDEEDVRRVMELEEELESFRRMQEAERRHGA